MNTIGPALPHACVVSILNSLQTTGATAGTRLTLSFGSDVTSNLNGLIDRPTATQFRALAAGYYCISYKALAYPAANDRGVRTYIRKNGTTDLTEFTGNSSGPANANDAQTISANHPVLLAANDYVELQADPIDAGAVNFQLETSLSLELIRLT